MTLNLAFAPASVTWHSIGGHIFRVYVLKFQTLFFFYSQVKCWLSGLEFTKCLCEWETGKTLIRLLLQKQSDLGLHFLSRPFK